MAAHQAPPSLGFSRQEHWSGVAISFSNAWKWKVKGKSPSRVRLLATPWTAAYQAPLSMGFSRQEYWSGVPLPSPTETQTNVLKKKYHGQRSTTGPWDESRWWKAQIKGSWCETYWVCLTLSLLGSGNWNGYFTSLSLSFLIYKTGTPVLI